MATPAEIAAARSRGFNNSLKHLPEATRKSMEEVHRPLAERRDKNVREFVSQVVAGRTAK